MNISLKGKHALVCGSTQGIGKETALTFASLGANVTLVARNRAALEKVVRQLPDHQQKHRYICADFAEPKVLRAALKKFMDKYGPAHILVNNTGGPPAGDAIDADTDEFIDAFGKHLICNQILTQGVVPGMKSEGYGRIINIISTSVKQPLKGLGVSNTIRGAVANWAKTLANELAAYNITVNNVLPGATKTQRLYDIIERRAEKFGTGVEVQKAAMIEHIPMQRFAEPVEIANAIAFLASPAASYITGINVPVDGGRTGCL